MEAEIKSPSKEFKIFLDDLNLAYHQFCLLEEINKNHSKPIFLKTPLPWKIIRVSLLHCYLSGLSKIFEKQDGKFDSVLSIYYLMDFEFKDHSETINKLKKLRNKFLMHRDLKTAQNLEQFIKKINLKPEKIDNLFKRTYEVTTKIYQNQGLHDTLNSLYEEIKEMTIKDISELIK